MGVWGVGGVAVVHLESVSCRLQAVSHRQTCTLPPPVWFSFQHHLFIYNYTFLWAATELYRYQRKELVLFNCSSCPTNVCLLYFILSQTIFSTFILGMLWDSAVYIACCYFKVTQSIGQNDNGEDFWLTVVPVGVTARFSYSPACLLFSPSCALFLSVFCFSSLPASFSLCCPGFCLTRTHWLCF